MPGSCCSSLAALLLAAPAAPLCGSCLPHLAPPPAPPHCARRRGAGQRAGAGRAQPARPGPTDPRPHLRHALLPCLCAAPIQPWLCQKRNCSGDCQWLCRCAAARSAAGCLPRQRGQPGAAWPDTKQPVLVMAPLGLPAPTPAEAPRILCCLRVRLPWCSRGARVGARPVCPLVSRSLRPRVSARPLV